MVTEASISIKRTNDREHAQHGSKRLCSTSSTDGTTVNDDGGVELSMPVTGQQDGIGIEFHNNVDDAIESPIAVSIDDDAPQVRECEIK